MEERNRAQLQRLLDAAALAGNAEMVREELAELRALAVRARAVAQAGDETQRSRPEDLLRGEGFGDRPEQQLVLFAEFQGTLAYLVGTLGAGAARWRASTAA